MSLRWWGFLATIVVLTGLAGLQFTFTRLIPTPVTEVWLFGLLFITFAAMAIPFSAYFNHRFASKTWRQQDPHRMLRHAGETGLFVVLTAYLQRIQVLDWMVLAVLLGVFILMETFFLTRG